MSLSADLISQFVKATNDTKKEKSETTVYGTIVKYTDKFYVQLDGSDQLTPYESTTDVAEGDRVTVRIKNHIATVSGNLKSPSARVDDLKGLAQTVLEMDTVLANKVDTKLLVAERARIDSLVAENATINGKLTAAEADILKIKTDYIDAKAIDAKYATIENLNATNATVYKLESIYGTFADLTASRLSAAEAVIDKLDVNYAKLGEFTAVKGRVESLEAGVADIDTLIFGSATGTTIQTSFANSVIAQLGDAQIKSAMIDSLSASKITAGKISTNLVQITSDDNSMLISDGTIQISDGNYVRVQIGKDASNDYSINIWDANGKLLFSEGGITENAIKSSIIRNDMVSDNANISASKLDINSLFDEINGSDKTIKSTRVYLDEKNQTLDVSFKQMTSDVEGLNDRVTSQGTNISVIQGQISSKIWQQDINAATGELNTKYTNLQQSLDGFKTEVSDNYAAKSDLDGYSTVSETKTLIEQSAKSITSTVSASYATKDSVTQLNTKITQTEKDITATINGIESDVTNASKTATNYLNFSSSGLVVGNHTVTSLKGNVLIDSDSVDIRNGTTVLSTFAADSIKLGLSTSKNMILNTDGVHLYEGSTYMAYFKPTEVRLGDKTGTNTNLKIANDLITFRSGNTATATYGTNEIHLGLNAQNTTIYLCSDIGTITGYKNSYSEESLKIESENVSVISSNRVLFEAVTGSSSRKARMFLRDSTSTGPVIGMFLQSYSSSDVLQYTEIELNNKMSLGTPGIRIGAGSGLTACSFTVKPSGVEVDGSLEANVVTASDRAWIGGIGFTGQNNVLWSGAEQMAANKEIILSEAVSSQPNGIVLTFSRYSSSTAQNYHWESFFIPKYKIVTNAALPSAGGYTFMLTTDGTFSVIGAKYLYLTDTSIKGNAINEAPSKSTSLTYYKYSNNSYVDNSVTFQNSGFVLRYVIGV